MMLRQLQAILDRVTSRECEDAIIKKSSEIQQRRTAQELFCFQIVAEAANKELTK